VSAVSAARVPVTGADLPIGLAALLLVLGGLLIIGSAVRLRWSTGLTGRG
jgi:uncharacterized integral membrane protein